MQGDVFPWLHDCLSMIITYMTILALEKPVELVNIIIKEIVCSILVLQISIFPFCFLIFPLLQKVFFHLSLQKILKF